MIEDQTILIVDDDAFIRRPLEFILREEGFDAVTAVEDRVLWVTIERPRVMNALHPPAHEELARVFDGFAGDDDLWAAVITGAGDRAFCSGADLKERATLSPIQVKEYIFTIRDLFATIENLNKPVIAAVNGAAAGWLFALAALGASGLGIYIGRFLRWRHGRLLGQILLLLVAVLIIYDGFTGPQVASENLATNIVWLQYRGFVMLALLLAGNLFCMNCPFAIPRSLARRWSISGRRWPRPLRNKWLALAVLFFYFFLYEWLDLWASPWLTAWGNCV